jgi:TonB family protein
MKKSILALAAVVALAPAAALAHSQEPVRVGGNVQAPERVKYVAPLYPAEAKSSRVTGIVILEALVDATGSVSDARVLKSIPELDQAAMDAVRQWRYSPTTLNGVPVPIVLTVTVNFSLSDTPTAEQLAGSMTAMNSALQTMTSAPVPSDWKGAPPVRVGGNIAPPERVKYVPPSYPVDAQQARVSGIVIIEAVIDESGEVAASKVLKSVPMLDDAALAAVSQWKYTPTFLNGAAVPVVMTVTVNFSLTTK